MPPRAYEDPNHPGNSSKHHTGKSCIVKDCTEPAGTMWGPWWCFEHNVERINRITKNLEEMERNWPEAAHAP